eukprot:93011_1
MVQQSLVCASRNGLLAFAHGSKLNISDPNGEPSLSIDLDKVWKASVGGGLATSIVSPDTPLQDGHASPPSQSKPVGAQGGPHASSTVRTMTFNPQGTLLFTAGDDKCVRMFDTETGHCLQSRLMEKKQTSVYCSENGSILTVADKVGCVAGFDARDLYSEPIGSFGHFSIVTDIVITPDQEFIISGDRDGKIRVSNWPNTFSIHQFCFGHTSFITKLCVISHLKDRLLSGGGDGAVRLWNFRTGELLSSLRVGQRDMSEEKFEVPSSPAPAESTPSDQVVVSSIAYNAELRVAIVATNRSSSLTVLRLDHVSIHHCGSIPLRARARTCAWRGAELWVATAGAPRVQAFRWDSRDVIFREIHESRVAATDRSLSKFADSSIMPLYENFLVEQNFARLRAEKRKKFVADRDARINEHNERIKRQKAEKERLQRAKEEKAGKKRKHRESSHSSGSLRHSSNSSEHSKKKNSKSKDRPNKRRKR